MILQNISDKIYASSTFAMEEIKEIKQISLNEKEAREANELLLEM